MLFWCWPCTATCYCHQISKDNSVMLLWHYARSLEQYLDHVSLGLYSYKWHKVYSLSSVYGFIAMMNYFPISAHINYLLRSGLIKNKIYTGDQTLWTPGRAAIIVKTRPHQLESWPALTRVTDGQMDYNIILSSVRWWWPLHSFTPQLWREESEDRWAAIKWSSLVKRFHAEY